MMFPGAQKRLTMVQLVSDVVKDTQAVMEATGRKGADVYLDLSPPAAGASGTPTHLTACLMVLKRIGVAMMAGGMFGMWSLHIW